MTLLVRAGSVSGVVEPIRSYHARRGRLSPNMIAALAELGPALDLAQTPDPLDLDAVFGRSAPRVLEIGSGLGDTVLHLAQTNPGTDYIASDVHTKGIARTLIQIQQLGLSNVRVLHADALRFVTDRLPAASLDEILVFFPDPWPKARHHKRRIVRPEFATACVRVLRPDGTVHLATDMDDYAEAMRCYTVAARRDPNDSIPLIHISTQSCQPMTPHVRARRRGISIHLLGFLP